MAQVSNVVVPRAMGASENSEMESAMPTPAAQQVKPDCTTPSPLDVAHAAIQVEAQFAKSIPSYTEEQRKAIRASKFSSVVLVSS